MPRWVPPRSGLPGHTDGGILSELWSADLRPEEAATVEKETSSCSTGLVVVVAMALLCGIAAGQEKNLLEDPSFEIPKQRDQFGLVFAKWGGWKYEGECEFRVGQVARTGKHSCLLSAARARRSASAQMLDLEPGPLPDHGLSPRAGHRHGHLEHDHGVHVRRQVHAAQQERHLRLDQAHLRRRNQGEEQGRAVVRPDGAGLLLGRRRLAW